MITTPFSPAELDEFRALIIAKIDEAEKDLALLTAALEQEPTKKPDAVIGDERLVQPDAVITREECDQLRKRQLKFIGHLQAALARIDNGTYGICQVTGQPISKERLRLVPHATLSLEAREAYHS